MHIRIVQLQRDRRRRRRLNREQDAGHVRARTDGHAYSHTRTHIDACTHTHAHTLSWESHKHSHVHAHIRTCTCFHFIKVYLLETIGDGNQDTVGRLPSTMLKLSLATKMVLMSWISEARAKLYEPEVAAEVLSASTAISRTNVWSRSVALMDTYRPGNTVERKSGRVRFARVARRGERAETASFTTKVLNPGVKSRDFAGGKPQAGI